MHITIKPLLGENALRINENNLGSKMCDLVHLIVLARNSLFFRLGFSASRCLVEALLGTWCAAERLEGWAQAGPQLESGRGLQGAIVHFTEVNHGSPKKCEFSVKVMVGFKFIKYVLYVLEGLGANFFAAIWRFSSQKFVDVWRSSQSGGFRGWSSAASCKNTLFNIFVSIKSDDLLCVFSKEGNKSF